MWQSHSLRLRPLLFGGIPGSFIKGEGKGAFPNFGLAQAPGKSGLCGSLSGHVVCSDTHSSENCGFVSWGASQRPAGLTHGPGKELRWTTQLGGGAHDLSPLSQSGTSLMWGHC